MYSLPCVTLENEMYSLPCVTFDKLFEVSGLEFFISKTKEMNWMIICHAFNILQPCDHVVYILWKGDMNKNHSVLRWWLLWPVRNWEEE